jgi:hypothetical protein
LIHVFLTLDGHSRTSHAERRVDGLARRVDRFAVARDAYEIFICMYIAARGFVRRRDTAPSPTPSIVDAAHERSSSTPTPSLRG